MNYNAKQIGESAESIDTNKFQESTDFHNDSQQYRHRMRLSTTEVLPQESTKYRDSIDMRAEKLQLNK